MIGETCLLRVDGEPYRCLDCKSNCFTRGKDRETGETEYECNGCGTRYLGENISEERR